jgi:hypothetical protein
MSTPRAIASQIRAVADHIVYADYSAAELRLIVGAMAATIARVESEINLRDEVARWRALRPLLTPDGAA